MRKDWIKEFDNMFADDTDKLSTGQALLKFKEDVNYYLVQDYIFQLLADQRKELKKNWGEKGKEVL